jgi:hypothetical protein
MVLKACPYIQHPTSDIFHNSNPNLKCSATKFQNLMLQFLKSKLYLSVHLIMNVFEIGAVKKLIKVLMDI